MNDLVKVPLKSQMAFEYFRDLDRLENPMLSLGKQRGLIIIDEIQRRSDLFPIIRVLVDQKEGNRKFLILGSALLELIKQSSETLAGFRQ